MPVKIQQLNFLSQENEAFFSNINLNKTQFFATIIFFLATPAINEYT